MCGAFMGVYRGMEKKVEAQGLGLMLFLGFRVWGK